MYKFDFFNIPVKARGGCASSAWLSLSIPIRSVRFFASHPTFINRIDDVAAVMTSQPIVLASHPGFGHRIGDVTELMTSQGTTTRVSQGCQSHPLVGQTHTCFSTNSSTDDDIHSTNDDIHSSNDDIHSSSDAIRSSNDDINSSKYVILSTNDDIQSTNDVRFLDL
jgi:hypothetical protein